MGKILHASYSGWFPFCILQEREYATIQGTLESIMCLFWRVRRFTLITNLASVGQVTTILQSVAEKEEDIVCSGSVWEFVQDDYVVSPGLINFNSIYSGGTETRATIHLEGPDGEVFWGLSLDFPQTFKRFDMGQTGLYVDWNCSNQDGDNYAVSISADLFWSYGGMYDTSTGKPL